MSKSSRSEISFSIDSKARDVSLPCVMIVEHKLPTYTHHSSSYPRHWTSCGQRIIYTQHFLTPLLSFHSLINLPFVYLVLLRRATTAPTTWHRPSVFIEDTRSHSLQPSVRRWPRAERHQLLCTDSAHSESAPWAWTVWHCAADGLPNCRRRQRLVGVHHGCRLTTHWGISTPWCACRLPSCGRADGHPAGRKLWWLAFPPGPPRQWPRPTTTASSPSN